MLSGSVGPTLSLSVTWSGTDAETITETEQTTTTGTLRLTQDPTSNSCIEIKSTMNKFTQRGKSDMQAVFTGWIGFKDKAAV